MHSQPPPVTPISPSTEESVLLGRLIAARFLFLFGIYAVGRYLLLFVAHRLQLSGGESAGVAGSVLAALTLLTMIASLPAGWIADRAPRPSLMQAGALISGLGCLLLSFASSI